MTVARKLLIITVVFFAIALLAITVLGVFSFSRSLRKQVDNDLDRLQQVFLSRLDELESLALALATEVANNPEVQAAFAAGDRERLTALTSARTIRPKPNREFAGAARWTRRSASHR